MNTYVITCWTICPRTFRRNGTQTKVVEANNIDHAKLVVDRHESVIKSVKLMAKQSMSNLAKHN
jgi:hypothetical protein